MEVHARLCRLRPVGWPTHRYGWVYFGEHQRRALNGPVSGLTRIVQDGMLPRVLCERLLWDDHRESGDDVVGSPMLGQARRVDYLVGDSPGDRLWAVNRSGAFIPRRSASWWPSSRSSLAYCASWPLHFAFEEHWASIILEVAPEHARVSKKSAYGMSDPAVRARSPWERQYGRVPLHI